MTPSSVCEVSVVFLIFNRPDLTARVFQRIRAARPAQLFVVADGPRADHTGDVQKCAEARKVTDEIDWPCVVHRNYSDRNQGCGARVSSGLDWTFSLVEEAIILEDDCLPHLTFFPFCAQLLERYRHESRIAQIAGCSFQNNLPANAESYYFSRYPHCWGWATWRRAWSNYDHQMSDWRATAGNGWLDRVVDRPAERHYWANCLNDTAAGRIDSWAYRWTATVWKKGWVSVLPYRNLISNIGFGAEGTNTRGASPWAMLPVSPMPFPLTHPVSFATDKIADARTGQLVFTPPKCTERLRRRLRGLFTR